MKEIILNGKKVLVGISRNGRIVITVDGERFIASKAISAQVIAALDDDLDEQEKADAILLAMAGYVVFENEEGVKFISNQASEAVEATVDVKAIKKVKTVEAETFSERIKKVKKTFNLATVPVANE